MGLYAAVDSLRLEIDSAQLGISRLTPFQTELAYLYYPVGGHYLRHRDVPAVNGGWYPLGRRAEDGGSFSGAALKRTVSFLLYLNEGWSDELGGQLRIFNDHLLHSGSSDGEGYTNNLSEDSESMRISSTGRGYFDVSPQEPLINHLLTTSTASLTVHWMLTGITTLLDCTTA